MSRWVALAVLALGVGCATTGIPPGNAQKGYVLWGFVGHDAQTAAGGQQVALVTPDGQPVQVVTADGFGKYVLAYHQPGQYQIVVGQLAMPIAIAGADQRIDIDLSNPTGAMNYAQQPKSKHKTPGQQTRRGPDGEPLPDLDQPVEGSDCWASAGCESYDSDSGYTYEAPPE